MYHEQQQKDKNDSSDQEDLIKEKISKSKIDKMFQKKNSTVLSKHYNDLKEESGDDQEEDLLTLVRKNHDLDLNEPSLASIQETSHKELLKTKRKELKKLGLGQKVIFDDDGNAINAFELESVKEFMKTDLNSKKEQYLTEKSLEMKNADILDKNREKLRLKELKMLRKIKGKQQPSPVETGVTLDPTSFSQYESESESEQELEQDYEESEEESEDVEQPKSKKMKLQNEELEKLALKLLE